MGHGQGLNRKWMDEAPVDLQMSCSDLTFKIGHQDDNPSYGHQDKSSINSWLSLQGNAIYNIMPDMISRLSDPEVGVEEDNFRIIMK